MTHHIFRSGSKNDGHIMVNWTRGRRYRPEDQVSRSEGDWWKSGIHLGGYHWQGCAEGGENRNGDTLYTFYV